MTFCTAENRGNTILGRFSVAYKSRNNKMTYLKLRETMINTNKCVKFISSEYLKVKLNHFLDVKCPGIERNLGT